MRRDAGMERWKQLLWDEPTQEDIDSRQWALRAKCSGLDPTFFVPPKWDNVRGANPDYDAAVTAALRFCNGADDPPCPVKHECGEWAMNNGIDDGVWGGLTEAERKQTRRARQR